VEEEGCRGGNEREQRQKACKNVKPGKCKSGEFCALDAVWGSTLFYASLCLHDGGLRCSTPLSVCTICASPVLYPRYASLRFSMLPLCFLYAALRLLYAALCLSLPLIVSRRGSDRMCDFPSLSPAPWTLLVSSSMIEGMSQYRGEETDPDLRMGSQTYCSTATVAEAFPGLCAGCWPGPPVP
jgi:hypothetical protein